VPPTTSRPDWRARLAEGLTPTAVATLVAASLLPFLGFMNVNRDGSFSAATVLTYAAVVAVVVVAVAAVALVALRRAGVHAVVFGVAAAVTLFFGFDAWEGAFELVGIQLEGSKVVRVGLWLVVAAVVVRLVAGLARHPVFRQWVLVTLVILNVVNLVGYGLAVRRSGGVETATATGWPTSTSDELVRSPNVYLFLLDAYARNDVLEEQTGYDNTPFHDALDERGFVTTEGAMSSYTATILSTMALFEGRYLATEPDDMVGGTRSFERFVRGDNSAVARFRQLGYRFVHSHAGPFLFARCDSTVADECIEADATGGWAGELEVVLLGLTPVPLLVPLEAPRTTPGFVLDRLEDLDVEEPFFLFAHVLAPHHPYMYDTDCELRGRAVSKYSVSLDEERDLYANEVRCVNEDVLATVDRIVEDDPEAIVLLLSDHGSELLTDWDADLEDWTDEAVRERFAVQNNLRLPEACAEGVADDTPLVADFEIVFACLEGRDPEPSGYRGFLWKFHTEYLAELPEERWRPMVEG
jgi:hypothetical protein